MSGPGVFTIHWTLLRGDDRSPVWNRTRLPRGFARRRFRTSLCIRHQDTVNRGKKGVPRGSEEGDGVRDEEPASESRALAGPATTMSPAHDMQIIEYQSLFRENLPGDRLLWGFVEFLQKVLASWWGDRTFAPLHCSCEGSPSGEWLAVLRKKKPFLQEKLLTEDLRRSLFSGFPR